MFHICILSSSIISNITGFPPILLLFQVSWTVQQSQTKKNNIGGNPVILDMMLLDSIQMWNMSYSHLMCYSNNIQLVIAIWHSMVEFDQIVKNSIHLNKWILNWNKVLKLSSFWYITCNSCNFFFNNHVHIGGVI